MDYVQLTLDDWLKMKEKLKQELVGVKHSFVRIGYVLRQIDDGKLYERDGYKSIAEFAKAEYGLEASTTSRFMAINREYSIDGYSERLRPEYEELGRSQLEEMLKLPEADRQMIGADTPREDIRDLKRFNRQEPAAGVADDLRNLVIKFYADHPRIHTEVSRRLVEIDAKELAELVNPSGNRSFRKGMFFLMMREDRIMVKRFGGEPQEMSWEEFLELTREVLPGMDAPKEPKEEPETEQTTEKEEQEQIAPAQKSETTEPKEEPKPEEIAPPPEPEEPEEQQAEVVEVESLITRKDYLDTLTKYGAAMYLSKAIENMLPKDREQLDSYNFWEEWFGTMVDVYGDEPMEG